MRTNRRPFPPVVLGIALGLLVALIPYLAAALTPHPFTPVTFPMPEPAPAPAAPPEPRGEMAEQRLAPELRAQVGEAREGGPKAAQFPDLVSLGGLLAVGVALASAAFLAAKRRTPPPGSGTA